MLQQPSDISAVQVPDELITVGAGATTGALFRSVRGPRQALVSGLHLALFPLVQRRPGLRPRGWSRCKVQSAMERESSLSGPPPPLQVAAALGSVGGGLLVTARRYINRGL